MKNVQKVAELGLVCLLVIASFIGCMKDNATKTYKVYRPKVEKLSEIHARIKNDAPQSIGTLGKICLYNNYIFAISPNKGIHVINNKNTSSPINESFINLPGCGDIAIVGDVLYADCYSDLVTINIRKMPQVSVVKIISNHFPDKLYAYNFSVDSTEAIVGWDIKDTVVSQSINIENDYLFVGGVLLSSNTASSIDSKSASVNGSMSRFAIQNNFLYTVSSYMLSALNISNLENPKVESKKYIGWNIETIYPFKDKLFIGSQTGMFIYDISTPSNPNYVTGFSHARVCDPVIADNNYAYVTLHTENEDNNANNSLLRCTGGTVNELDVLDVSNLNNVQLVKQYNMSQPKGLGKEGNTLVICDGKDGVKFYDATDPANLILKKTIEVNNAYDVICLNGIALVTTKNALYQYQYSDINNIKLLSTIAY